MRTAAVAVGTLAVIGAPVVLGVVGAPGWMEAAGTGLAAAVVSHLIHRVAAGTRAARAARSASSGLAVVAAALILLAVPAAVDELHLRVDVTANSRLTLSGTTLAVLDRLQSPVEITAFFEDGSLEATQIRDLVAQYQRKSDLVELEVVDPTRSPGIAKRFGVRRLGEIFVDHEGRREEAPFLAEIELTSAIVRAVDDTPSTLCALTGHGEADFGDTSGIGGFGQATEALRTINVEIREVALAANPSGLETCDVATLAGPRVDLSDDELDALAGYLDDHGSLLVLADPSSTTDLGPVLGHYGIDPVDELVLDRASSLPGDPSTLLVDRFPSANPVGGGLAQLVLPETGAARLSDDTTRGLVTSPIATTSPAAELLAPTQPDLPSPRPHPANGEVVLAASAEETGVAGRGDSAEIQRTRIVWIGDSDFATNVAIGQVSNEQLLVNAVAWLAQDEDLIAIGAPVPDYRELFLSTADRNRLLVVTVGLTPASLVGLGAFGRWRARRLDRRPPPAVVHPGRREAGGRKQRRRPRSTR